MSLQEAAPAQAAPDEAATAPLGRPPGEVRQALLGELREQGPLSMRDLAQHTQVGYRAARWTLARCVQAGLVVKAGQEKRAHSRKLVALYELADKSAAGVTGATQGHGWVDLGRCIGAWVR